MRFRHSAHGLETPRGEDWRKFSACLGEDPELFHPIGEAGRRGADAQAQEDRAKAICARCPVKDDCLEFALIHVPDGIAGGLNEAERRRVRRASPQRQRAYSRTVRAVTRETCKSGKHRLTGDNVLVSSRKDGRTTRACRACRKAYEAARTTRAARSRGRARQAVAA